VAARGSRRTKRNRYGGDLKSSLYYMLAQEGGCVQIPGKKRRREEERDYNLHTKKSKNVQGTETGLQKEDAKHNLLLPKGGKMWVRFKKKQGFGGGDRNNTQKIRGKKEKLE